MIVRAFVVVIALVAPASIGCLYDVGDPRANVSHRPGEGEPAGEGEGEGGVEGEGEPDTSPVCVARVKSLNGADIPIGTVPSAIESFDNVVLSLDQSQAISPATSIAQFRWILTEAPSADVTLTSPQGIETRFAQGLRVPGTYTVDAVVLDDRGVASSNACSLTLDVVSNEFAVVLSWSGSANNFDLHVTKLDVAEHACVADVAGDAPTGFFAVSCEDGLDCDAETCVANAPDWDNDGTTTSAGDPSILLDDSGLGPDIVRVRNPAVGDYLVSIQERVSSSTLDSPLVEVLRFGELSGSWTLSTGVGSFAEVALVRVFGGGVVCVEDLTDGDAHDQCG